MAARSGSKSAPKNDFGRTWVDLGSPRGSILAIFRLLSDRVGRLARTRADMRKTCKNLCKTIGFDSFFTRPLLRARRENQTKIVPNALLDRVALQNASERLSWALLGRSWALLGRSWGALGGSRGALGCSWGALGALLDARGAFLGALGTLLGALGELLGALWALLGPPGRSWLDF